mmetsp:Transcript_20790/g.59582  ORF Transcript_20790/g.59582 Transcript_20790/m.59582 type:complete len:689 (+) Transcript_20790:305-2371(+)
MASSPNQGTRSIPPPSNEVLPRGIGPIDTPNCNDVLSGRGGRINAHPGNVQFRTIIASMKSTYLSPKTRKLEKAHIANDIVRRIRRLDPPGRFLKEDKDGTWWDIGDEKARKKVGQALREDAPDIRPQLGSGAGGGGAAAVAKAVAEDIARREVAGQVAGQVVSEMMAMGGENGVAAGGGADLADLVHGGDDGGGLSRISGTDGLLPGPPPPQMGPYRTPSFTSGRGMSPRGTAGGRGHPASPAHGYPPYDSTQHRGQTQHQGWYAHPPAGGGVYPTQQAGVGAGTGTDRNPSQMTFGGNTFHPTESAGTADVSDISGLSLNVGADIPPGTASGGPSPSAAAAGASGGSGGSGRAAAGGGEMRFSHRSAWQHNQLRNRAARYAQAAAGGAEAHAHHHHHPGSPQAQHDNGQHQHAHHPSRYAHHLHQQQYQHHQHQQHHHGGQYQLPQPSPIKGSDKSSGASKMSELSMSMSFGGLTGSDPMGKLARSLSIPGFNSRDLMSLGEASFHALLEDEALANFDAELRRANPKLGYAGAGPADGTTAPAASLAHVSEETGQTISASNSDGGGKPPARESASSKSSSAAKSSGQHSTAEASQRSNISMAEVSMASVRSSASSWMRNYRGQDPSDDHEIDGTDMVNPWLAMEGQPDSGGDQFSTGGSQLSILSEISTELMALDLADGPPVVTRR